MTEARRYLIQKTPIGTMMKPNTDGNWVEASDYDASLEREAALREELDTITSAYRAELDELAGRNYDMRFKLADAERRNVDISILLSEAFNAGDVYVFGTDLYERLYAALNKPEEAKS